MTDHTGYLDDNPTERGCDIRYGIGTGGLDRTDDLVSAHVVASVDGQAFQCARDRGNDVHDVTTHLRIVGRIIIVIIVDQVPDDASDDSDPQYNDQVDEKYPTHIRILILSSAAGDLARNENVQVSLFTVTKRGICRACCQFGPILNASTLYISRVSSR